MKIVTVVGARPQFIKAAPVSRAFHQAGLPEYLLHTGQHYDYGMSQVFFDELNLPEPDCNLGIGSGSHGEQTGQMLAAIEAVLLEQQPDWVVVYGDTNSTLAGALAAVKLHIPVAHIEAGLRSFNRRMPEEHNRVLTDHCADLLLCPSQTAVRHLQREGLSDGVYFTGDVMYDAALQFSEIAVERSNILSELQINPREYLLATVHRPANTDDSDNLGHILSAFAESGETVIFPVHPRTRKKIETYGLLDGDPAYANIHLIEPVGYLDMLVLERNARLVVTDSGGMQKEAYFFAVPCVTLRADTEWPETVETGWNALVGADRSRIVENIHDLKPSGSPEPFYGDGDAADKIAKILAEL